MRRVSERSFFGASRDMVVVVDSGLRILRAGTRAGELADRPAESLVSMSLIAAFGSAELDAVVQQALSRREAAVGEAQIGHSTRRSYQVEAVPAQGGAVVVFLHDITGLRGAERVRRDFVANISHELRTPLSSVKLLAETLAEGMADSPGTAREFAAHIQREVDHLIHLVDELFDLSLIESGQTPLTIEPVDPTALVSNVAARVAPVAERRSIAVRVAAHDEALPSRVDGDIKRLSQALLNLAHNAVKFSHPGGEVRLGWEARDQGVRFSVADDGIGVPEEHQARVFERFYKVDRSRVRSDEADRLGASTGLGLAIVRHIAEAHGGGVGMRSQEGVGSVFWLDIPQTDESASADA